MSTADIGETSFRMRGMGPNLIGFVNDEYTNLFYNPAYIHHFEGLKVYNIDIDFLNFAHLTDLVRGGYR
jgi:hypothetical protein